MRLGSASDPGEPVASLHYKYRGRESSASILLHDSEDDFSMLVAGPEIKVVGDFGNYHYQFYYDGCRIGQVCGTRPSSGVSNIDCGGCGVWRG